MPKYRVFYHMEDFVSLAGLIWQVVLQGSVPITRAAFLPLLLRPPKIIIGYFTSSFHSEFSNFTLNMFI